MIIVKLYRSLINCYLKTLLPTYWENSEVRQKIFLIISETCRKWGKLSNGVITLSVCPISRCTK